MSEDNGMVNLTVNGRQVEARLGTSVLQAAEKAGIKIPTLCYHKALPAYGACRLCLVEVSQGGRKASLQASCTYPVSNGLVVETDTPRVRKTRKVMAELLLARCPESEEVKRIARELGVGKPRIEPKNEDCLLCGLCVRMCRERMGKGAIGFAGRGDRRFVQPAFDVQSDVCQTCGACFSICPTKCIELGDFTPNKPVPILSEFDEGLRERKAIYIPYPQAVPNYATIDAEHCIHLQTGECQVCREFCEADAIDFDQKEQKLSLRVGSVIVADGAEKFSPALKYEFGYGRCRNVVTSVEFERILAASGPFSGHVQRPHDGKVPKRIAWIQCVGSRDEREDRSYCSSVCCMYAIKEATIAKEHVKEIEPTIFYMDIRAHGKDFDAFYNRAKDRHGVRFVRSRVGKVLEVPESGNLMVYYTTEDNPRQLCEEFDMVVLSVGLEPRRANSVLADQLDVKLNKHRFFKTSSFSPVATSRPGVFVCGPACGPKDIPETVMEASGAAAAAESVVAAARGTEIVPKTYPPERDVRGEPPRIGVFICHCGINIGSVVDVPGVVEFARGLPGVVYAEENLFTCSQDTQQKISSTIREQRLNRVVVASCSPRTHEPLFQETLREAGLNPCLFEMANIRDQCSWIHGHVPEEATEKSKTLVRMAVAKAGLLEPLHAVMLPVTQRALVIGGGLAGMTAALTLADEGFEAVLVERAEELGGNLRNLYHTIQGEDIQEYLVSLVDRVDNCPGVEVYRSASIKETEGYIGNYRTTLGVEGEDEPVTIEHGVVIVATGAIESEPNEYLYGEDDRVITQVELEKRLQDPKAHKIGRLKNVVMVQCVGSRDEEHPWCSRVCCQDAVKNALRLRELNPKVNVYVLYRDMRTYGFFEEYYRLARESGVTFIRYEADQKPVVAKDGDDLTVRMRDLVLETDLVLNPDLLVLAPAIVPQDDAGTVSRMLKVPLNENNFFLEAHVKLRPVDFATEGVFLAGLAHSPKNIPETIAQAKAAAARAGTILSKDKYRAGATTSVVDESTCSGCGLCVANCPYGALELVAKADRVVSHVNEALCKGCGNCAAVCPSDAIGHLGFRSRQTVTMLNAALKAVRPRS